MAHHHNAPRRRIHRVVCIHGPGSAAEVTAVGHGAEGATRVAPAHDGAVLKAEAVPHPAESSDQATTTCGDAGVFVSVCAPVVVVRDLRGRNFCGLPSECTEKVA